MEEHRLEELRRSADDLEPGEEALAAYSAIFEAAPHDQGSANMVGRSLQVLGRLDEAREHWDLVVELQPDNAIARDRARSLKHRPHPPAHASSAPTMTDPEEIRAFYTATTDRMRALLDELARTPGARRTNPQLESALGWDPLSVRATAAASTRRIGDRFGGRSPMHWTDGPDSRSGRFEIWMDEVQARTIRGENRDESTSGP